MPNDPNRRQTVFDPNTAKPTILDPIEVRDQDDNIRLVPDYRWVRRQIEQGLQLNEATLMHHHTEHNRNRAEFRETDAFISRRARQEINEDIEGARRAAKTDKTVSVQLPDLTANGTKVIGLLCSPRKMTVEKIQVCYQALPGSALGTIVLDIYKRARAQASLTIANASPDGDVIYTANEPGLGGEAIRVEHVTGATGAGNENRPLAVSVSANDITVTFGTDGGGASVVPDSATVAAAVNAHLPALALVYATAGGDGTGLSTTAAFANLAGGLVSTLMQPAAGHDLEALTAGVPDTVADKLLDVSTRRMRADEYLYCEITSDNADALPGAGGVLTLTYSL